MEEVEEWFHAYGDDIYHYLIYYTGHRDVEDLVQETFIRALKGRQSFRGHSSVKTWLFSIARNAAKDRSKKNEPYTLDQDSITQWTKTTESPESISIEKEKFSDIVAMIYTLPKRQQEILLLRGISELTTEETANVLGISKAAVYVHFHRGLKKLRRAMNSNPGGEQIE